MNRNANRRRAGSRNAGISLVELLLVLVVTLALCAIAAPRLLAAQATAREAAAVSALRTIAAAQEIYALTYHSGYAPNLTAMGPPQRGTEPHAGAAALIDELLAAGSRNGYIFKYTALDHNGDGSIDSYTVSAEPNATGLHSQKYFYLDPTMSVRSSMGAPATGSATPEPAFSSAVR